MFRITQRSVAAMLCLGLAFAAASCGSRQSTEEPTASNPSTTTPEVQVTQVELGRDLDANNRVTVPTDQFKPGDVVYVTVMTSGSAPGATLKSVWTTEDGQVVDESQQVLASTGDAVTEFHVSKPEGLPTGKYKVEISLNGTPIQSKEFQIITG
jgi:hypothetical protein